MREIILASGQIAVVDDVDYDDLSQFSWSLNDQSYGYAAAKIAGQKVFMHIRILDRQGIAHPEQVDHEDRNRLNNQRFNLRPATCSQNQWNQGQHANNVSGFPGVSWYARNSKWRVQITRHGIKYHLGYFDTAEQASAAYQKAKGRYHGAKTG